jgi:hypothetical protein
MSVGVLGIDAGRRLTVRRSFFLAPNPAEDQDIAYVAYLKTAVANSILMSLQDRDIRRPSTLIINTLAVSSHLKTAVPTFSGAADPSRSRAETYSSGILRYVAVDCTRAANYLLLGCHSRSAHSLSPPLTHPSLIAFRILRPSRRPQPHNLDARMVSST